MDARLSLQQIAAFLKLAELGSFRDAASALGVSQPALSRSIQQIEARLGTRLFDRDTRRVHLTPSGECLYPLVQRVSREYTEAFAEFDEFMGGRRGVVRIAALPSMASLLLPEVVNAFHRQDPGVRIEIWEDVGTPVHRAVLERSADIGLAPPPQTSDGLHYRPLLRDELVMVCRRDDPLATAHSYDWSVFTQRPFITTSHETGLRTMIDHALLEAGVQAEPLFNCKQPATVGSLVDASTGIGALSRLSLAQLRSDTLVGIPLREPAVARSLGVVTHIGRSLSPAARAVLAETERAAARLAARLADD